MRNPEYDGVTPPAGGAAAGELEERAREQRKAVEEEAIESEHLDYFLDNVAGTDR